MPVKICVSGKMAAGKSTLALALSHHFGIQIVSFGDIIRRRLRQSRVEPTREALHRKSEQIVAAVGNYGAMDWFVANSPQIDWGGDLIVEGCRHPETFYRMEDLFSHSVLIHCSCSRAVQIHRIMERDGFTANQAQEVTSCPTEDDHDSRFVLMADIVHNERTLQATTIRALMLLLQNSKKGAIPDKGEIYARNEATQAIYL